MEDAELLVADDVPTFARQVVRLAGDDRFREDLAAAGARFAADQFSPGRAYGPLIERLSGTHAGVTP